MLRNGTLANSLQDSQLSRSTALMNNVAVPMFPFFETYSVDCLHRCNPLATCIVGVYTPLSSACAFFGRALGRARAYAGTRGFDRGGVLSHVSLRVYAICVAHGVCLNSVLHGLSQS